MIWFWLAVPNFCTTLSVDTGSSALRMTSSDVGCVNCSTTDVPPEKSMPSGRPPRSHMLATPPQMRASERIRACQRHLMKL